jgi:glycosyltransferase involved in cell wall biosynthesis
MEQRKLRVGFVTSSILVKTGFSNNIRSLLPFLYKSGKYELFHLNQGMGETPDFQRFPWKNFPVLQNGTFDVARFQSQDEGYKRHVSYGNLAVEKFIIDNKLDVVIHVEDIWSSAEDAYIKAKWWPYLKNNFLQWTTADSLPILPNFKTWAENCPNMWFWTSFAEEALKEENKEKYSHVTTVPGCLIAEEYQPLLKYQKEDLRKKFNIDLDTFIFLQLGRNQLRKLYPFTIESFAKFKKRNPSIKSKLLFHTAWYEGWPLDRIREEWKVDKADILTTYFCRNCGQWEIKPYEGEFRDCKYCGAKGQPPSQENNQGNGQKTAGIDSPITNKEMSKIYGIADGAVSTFTSGGLEFFNVESLLCGIPLLCSDYSCGTYFTHNDFVFSLDGEYTYEVGTAFKKHVPNVNTMIKFYEKICSMSDDKRRDIVKRGREWALNTFDVSSVGKKLEDWIDSRKPIEWDYKYQFDPKNPFAEIKEISDNKEFTKQCYKEILKMEVKDDDSGLIYWLQFLANPQNKRDQMVNYMRNVAAGENQKNAPQVDYSEMLIKNKKKNLLIILKESIGDIILSTAILKSFRDNYPSSDWNIYYATSQQYKEILDGNPNIDKVLDYQQFMESEIHCTGAGKTKGYFDAYCHLGNNTQHKLNYLTNNLIDLPRKRHS